MLLYVYCLITRKSLRFTVKKKARQQLKVINAPAIPAFLDG